MSLRTFNNGDQLLNVRQSVTNNFDELFRVLDEIKQQIIKNK